MSQGTRSQSRSAKSVPVNDSEDFSSTDIDNSDRLAFLESFYSRTQANTMGTLPLDDKPLAPSNLVLNHSFGLLYPVPASIKSPQIAIFQTGLLSLSTCIFRAVSDISQWFDDFLAQALLINMHEYFSGRVIFQLHPLCEVTYYHTNATLHQPFSLKTVTDNVAYLEFTSPSHILASSTNDFFTDTPTPVYVTKNQMDVVNYITKLLVNFSKI
jgi:hypothetical protein